MRVRAFAVWGSTSVTGGLVVAATYLSFGGSPFDTYAFLPMIASFSFVGMILSRRLPRNPIGWLFCGAGLSVALLLFLDAYATHVGFRAGVSEEDWAAWIFIWVLELSYGPLVFLFMLFPTGSLPSPRWRPIAWSFAAAIAAGALLSASSPVNLHFNFPGAEPPVKFVSLTFARPAYAGYQSLLLLMLCTGALCLMLRLYRSRGDERQQLKWFFYIVAVSLIGTALSDVAGIEPLVVNVFAFPLLPIAVGVAVVKYRLYDIDRIINRTLAYGCVTAFLGLSYLVIVLLLQEILGQRVADSPLAVAATTLAVAALFRPARARIQALIDRRFNRRRYDAQKTIDAFGARLRDEVDLETLSSDLVYVVGETMQPAHVSLWLRPSGAVDRRRLGTSQ